MCTSVAPMKRILPVTMLSAIAPIDTGSNRNRAFSSAAKPSATTIQYIIGFNGSSLYLDWRTMMVTAMNFSSSSVAAQRVYFRLLSPTLSDIHFSRSMANNTAIMPPMNEAARSHFGSPCSLSSRSQNHSQMREGRSPAINAYINELKVIGLLYHIDFTIDKESMIW